MTAPGAIETPHEPGGFEGDIFFGDPRNSTRGTHRWQDGGWEPLPSEEVALMGLLAVARSRAQTAEAERDRLIEALSDARFFIQDSLTNGHLSGGDVGNLMGARDVIDRAILKATGDAK